MTTPTTNPTSSTSPLRQGPWRCPKCGDLVNNTQPTLDPRYVIGRCRSGKHQGSVIPVRAKTPEDALRIVEEARLAYLARIGEDT